MYFIFLKFNLFIYLIFCNFFRILLTNFCNICAKFHIFQASKNMRFPPKLPCAFYEQLVRFFFCTFHDSLVIMKADNFQNFHVFIPKFLNTLARFNYFQVLKKLCEGRLNQPVSLISDWYL